MKKYGFIMVLNKVNYYVGIYRLLLSIGCFGRYRYVCKGNKDMHFTYNIGLCSSRVVKSFALNVEGPSSILNTDKCVKPNSGVSQK